MLLVAEFIEKFGLQRHYERTSAGMFDFYVLYIIQFTLLEWGGTEEPKTRSV